MATLGPLLAAMLAQAVAAPPVPRGVKVLFPNGGEVLQPGEPVTVRWSAGADEGRAGIAGVSLLVSYDNGASFETVAGGIENSGAADLTPADRRSGVAIFRVEAIDARGNAGADESDGVFGVGREPVTEDGSGEGGGAGVVSSPLPTTIEDFHLPGTQPGMVQPIQDSGVCAQCHLIGVSNPEIPVESERVFRWQGSMMAHASRDPLFEACLAIAEQDAPGSGDLCLRCHIPTAWLAGRSSPTDGSAVLSTDRDGVTCNFCHRMLNPIFDKFPGFESPDEDAFILAGLAAINEQPPFPSPWGNGMYVVDPTGFVSMRGPRSDAFSPGHSTLVSPFHRQGEFCGTCHDVSNPAYSFLPSGRYAPNDFNARPAAVSQDALMPIERTFSEWKHSEFATSPNGVGLIFGRVFRRVRTCQDCHMRREGGKVCRQFHYEGRDDAIVHDLTGGNTWVPGLLAALHPGEFAVDPAALEDGIERARRMLENAARLEAEPIGQDLRVRVYNDTGHKLPTGYPEGRRMWLSLKFFSKTNEVLKASGNYDFSTGVLTKDPEAKIYEVELGIDSSISSRTGIPAGKTFHFVLNNVVLKDNRIPPRGFTNAAFQSFHGEPVDYEYDDGQYWDDTYYEIPPGAARVNVILFY